MQLLIATSNPGKIKEISQVLTGLDLELFTLKDLNINTDVEETGSSYAENAEIKARFFYKEAEGKMPVVAADSGVRVEALDDELGVYTRRWGSGSKASDQEWIDFFLDRMKQYPNPEQRKAWFSSNFCYFDGQEVKHFLGECAGIITKELEADIIPGLPLSSCFLPNESEKVFAALSTDEKSKISHRGRAAKKFREYLSDLLNE
jgi:XTP/dITP diphosphohydrolase